MRGGLLTVCGLAVVAVCFAPAAGAVVSATFSEIPNPIQDAATTTLTVTVDCERIMPVPFTANSLAHVDIVVDDPEAFTVTGPLTVNVPTSQCPTQPTGQIVATQDYVVSATESTPGLLMMGFDTTVTLEATGADAMTTAEPPHSFSFVFSFAYNASIEVSGQQLLNVPGDKRTATLTVENFGNARTRVHAEVVEKPGAAGVSLGEDFILERRGAGEDTTYDFNVTFREPAGKWTSAVVVVELTPSAADDPNQQGEPVEVHLAFKNTDNGERAVPALPMMPIVGLLAVAAALRRRGTPRA